MNDYTKKARVYPAIIALYVPMFLTVLYLSRQIKIIQEWNVLCTIGSSLISSAIVSAAFGYFCWQICRSISKSMFQYPMFREDETYMPTTNYLLWANKTYHEEEKSIIHQKIYDHYRIKLCSKRREAADEFSARKLIAGAVRQMREDTRDDPILLGYNVDFGFWRNLMGGCVIGELMIIVICGFSYVAPSIPEGWLVFGLCTEALAFFVGLYFLKQAGRSYARQLISAFLSLRGGDELGAEIRP